MVAPVTGPFLDIVNNRVDGPGSRYRRQDRFRQKKPYNLELSYNSVRTSTGYGRLIGSATSYDGLATAGATKPEFLGLGIDSDKYWGPDLILAENECWVWCKKGIVAANAELLITAVEYQKTIDMIAHRGRQLLTFLVHLRSGRIRKAREAASAFGWLRPGPKRRRKPPRRKPDPSLEGLNKDAANLLLEVQFGWMPLQESLFNAMRVLSNPMPMQEFRSSGKAPIGVPYYKNNPAHEVLKSTTTGKVRVYARGVCWVSRENVYLLNRLGILNPVAAAWDAIPMSFVLDWFINVKQFLDSYTDLLGVGLDRVSHTKVYKVDRVTFRTTSNGAYGYEFSDSFRKTTRILGMPNLRLTFKRPRFDLFQARTIWALIVQRL